MSILEAIGQVTAIYCAIALVVTAIADAAFYLRHRG